MGNLASETKSDDGEKIEFFMRGLKSLFKRLNQIKIFTSDLLGAEKYRQVADIENRFLFFFVETNQF